MRTAVTERLKTSSKRQKSQCHALYCAAASHSAQIRFLNAKSCYSAHADLRQVEIKVQFPMHSPKGALAHPPAFLPHPSCTTSSTYLKAMFYHHQSSVQFKAGDRNDRVPHPPASTLPGPQNVLRKIRQKPESIPTTSPPTLSPLHQPILRHVVPHYSHPLLSSSPTSSPSSWNRTGAEPNSFRPRSEPRSPLAKKVTHFTSTALLVHVNAARNFSSSHGSPCTSTFLT